MKTMTRLLAALTLGASCAVHSGCLVVAAGAAAGAATAGVLYVRGELRSTVESDVKSVVSAAEGALKEMDLIVVSVRSSSAEGEVIGRTAQDDRVLIKVYAETDTITRYTIRIGTFGNEALSRHIDEKIRERL